jgi:cytochrome c oxidase subunit 2
MVTVWVTLFIFIIVGGTLLWAVFYFREREADKDKPMPPQGHGNPLVEVGLIGVSILLLVIIGIPTLRAVWYMDELPDDPQSLLGAWYKGPLSEKADEEVLTINVMGYQWWWAFEYPQLGIVTANEFTIPVGKTVKLNLKSVDVIHSFWLPKLAGKVDLIPGRANWMWVRGDELGYYYGQCAEFCGSAHAYMSFRAEVVSSEAFQDWVKHQKEDAKDPVDPKALEGMQLFTDRTCVLCHKIQGNTHAQGVKGPNLTHVATRKTLAAGILDNRIDEGPISPEKQRENLFNWVHNSDHLKPGNLMFHDPMGGLKSISLSQDDIDKIVAYLQTLQ